MHKASCKDCDQNYVGQIQKRETHFDCRQIEKLSFAKHVHENKHITDMQNLKLIKKCV